MAIPECTAVAFSPMAIAVLLIPLEPAAEMALAFGPMAIEL